MAQQAQTGRSANYRIVIRLPDGTPSKMETEGLGEAIDQARRMIKHGSTVNIYDYSSIQQQLKQQNVPQRERNKIENILDELKTNPSTQKRKSLMEKGKSWIVKNQKVLGASAEIVRRALGMPDTA